MPSVPLKQNVRKILHTVIKSFVFLVYASVLVFYIFGNIASIEIIAINFSLTVRLVFKTPIFAPSLTLVYYRQQVPVTPSSLNSSAAFVLHTPSQECLLWYGQVWTFLI